MTSDETTKCNRSTEVCEPPSLRASEVSRSKQNLNGALIYRAMRKKLLKGDPKVFAVLADRAFGKVKHNSAQSASAEDGKIIVQFIDVAKFNEP